MPLDKVQPLKLEDSGTGGTEVDEFPTALDPLEDYVECRGVALANSTTRDEQVVLSRTGDTMTFQDGENVTPVTLSDLVAGTSGITVGQHKVLRQLIHFIEDGPAGGFASGAYKETLPAGNPFPTSVIWWESSDKLKKIVEKSITRNVSQMPTSIVWQVYDTDGSTVLETVTDAITYTSNVFESSRTRTIS